MVCLMALCVEAAAYVLRKPKTFSSKGASYIRLLSETTKGTPPKRQVHSLQQGTLQPETYLAPPETFERLPGSPHFHRASPAFRNAYRIFKPLE